MPICVLIYAKFLVTNTYIKIIKNGPAIHFVNENKHWYKTGVRHRDNDPSIA